jgi:single-strand DNA-binding protein
MANLNRVLLIGNLTRDPEVRYTSTGTAVTEIGIAVNRAWTDENGTKRDEATFVDVTLWARQAEVAQEYLVKGRQVLIEGRLKLDSWTDQQSGQKRSKLRVVAENMQMLGGRADTEGASSPPTGQRQSAPKQPAPPPQRPAPKEPEPETEPDDIPF